MTDRALTPQDLTGLLEQLRLQSAGGKAPSDVAEAQMEWLLARIGFLTETLRGSGSNDTTAVASRLLLSDLALVVAQFRGKANAFGSSLSSAITELPPALERPDAATTAD